MALYHKHRPQLFETLVGQEHIVQTITNQIKLNKPGHAYLFSGPRGVGKTTIARLLAKALNCDNRKDGQCEPCDNCSSCQEIASNHAIDVIEIDAASHTGVDNVRENIIDNAQFKPTKSKYKIFIIDEVHMLSTSAFNALLKTLEEPPIHVIFILATTEIHKLPDTIVSRCQRYNFKNVPFDTMLKHLESILKIEDKEVDIEVLKKIVNKSDGCVRDAVSLLDQILASGEKHITEELASLILPASRTEDTVNFISLIINNENVEALGLLSKLMDDGIRTDYLANDILELLRLIMIQKLSGSVPEQGLDLNSESLKKLVELSKNITNKQIIDLIDLVQKRSHEIKSSPIPQLPLEMVIVEWTVANESIKDQVLSIKDDKLTNTNNEQIANNKYQIAGNAKIEDQLITNNEQRTTNNTEQINESTNSPIHNNAIIDKVIELVQSEPDISFDEVKAKWGNFIEKMEAKSPSLVFVLKMAELSGVKGNYLQIFVPYSFHRDKIHDKQCQRNIEVLLEEVYGKKVHIEAIVREQIENETPTTIGGEINELATMLGGEVVN